VASVSPPTVNAARDAAVIIVYPTTAPQSAQTALLVHQLRDQVIPRVTAGSGVTAFVGGQTAAGADTSVYLSARLPWVIGMVVVLAFLLLVVVFRSIAIPVKAAVMNLLSIGAAYGVIVAVYQCGWLASLFGASRGPIDPWIPLMMFTITFGLSMDYEVFLLSRMREEWLQSGDNSKAVAHGLGSTARVITAAAAIMVCVFGSFVIGDRCASSACSAWAWRSRSSSMPPSSAWSWYLRSCSSLGLPIGGCPTGSSGQPPAFPSSRTGISLRAAAWAPPGGSAWTSPGDPTDRCSPGDRPLDGPHLDGSGQAGCTTLGRNWSNGGQPPPQPFADTAALARPVLSGGPASPAGGHPRRACSLAASQWRAKRRARSPVGSGQAGREPRRGPAVPGQVVRGRPA
jgi:hypothetical protein